MNRLYRFRFWFKQLQAQIQSLELSIDTDYPAFCWHDVFGHGLSPIEASKLTFAYYRQKTSNDDGAKFKEDASTEERVALSQIIETRCTSYFLPEHLTALLIREDSLVWALHVVTLKNKPGKVRFDVISFKKIFLD